MAFDGSLVIAAVLLGLFCRNGAGRDMDVGRQNVHMIKKGFMHPKVVAMWIIFGHRVVFIEIECHDAGKIQALFFVEANQLAIQIDRS